MKFGLFSLMPQRDRDRPQVDVFAEVADQVRVVEQMGFDIAWFAEHHFSNYSICPSPLIGAAYCAAQTSTIKLGTGVLVLPLYHPIRMVEEIAQVDGLSNGRLVVGIGSGYQEFEFERFGQKLGEASERTLEILDIIELAMTREEFSYDGKYYTQPSTPMSIRPVQQPMPPVYVAGFANQPKVQNRVAMSGYVPFVTAGYRPASVLADMRRIYEQAHRDAGKDPATMPFACQRMVYVTDSREDALDAAENARYTGRVALSMRGGYQELDGAMLRDIPAEGEPSLEQIVDNLIIGDAETCAEKLVAELKLLQPSHYSCFMQFGRMDGKRVRRSIDAFGEKVLPAVKEALGDLDAIGAQAPVPTPMVAAE